MKRFFLSVICITLMLSVSNAYISDNMKGVWVASVYNLDYPSNPTTDVSTLKNEIIKILDSSSNLGFNAVFLQVRPSADALYKSNIFPWSKYLTGKSGLSPNDNFDPLEFWIEEAHERGIELHAWINPYRVTKNGDAEYSAISNSSPAKKHPEYLVRYSDGNYYFNPGIPEVRKLVIDGALELVRNYDIDGIHMDDYFYPGTSFDDSATYSQYGSKFPNIGDWRRNNVDLLIQELNASLHEADKDISFGISPFAVWANKSNNSLGSDTKATESYYSHYADTRKWVLNSWLDYIAPQIYWETGNSYADYTTILNWWCDVLKNCNTKLYIGLADYKSLDVKSNSVWYKGAEIEKQIKLNDEKNCVAGEIHYRYSSIVKDKNLCNIMKKYYKCDDIIVFSNGHKVSFDQKPFIESGRTLVPMRAMFEALNAKIEWDGKTNTVTAKKGKIEVSLIIGNNKMKVNGIEKKLDVSAKIVNGRTMIPLRAVSEALMVNVGWYENTKTIIMTE